MQHAILIPADEDESISIHEYSETNSLNNWYRIVFGDQRRHFDVVSTPMFDIWVDDEGLLDALPVNQRLMALLYALYDDINPNLILVGPALLTGPPDDEGDTKDLDPMTIAKIVTVLTS